MLHGQFFVDAGRRGIDYMEFLHKPFEPLPVGDASQPDLICQWNQALAQKSVLPAFLPTLAEYVTTIGLKDDEVTKLTAAIKRCVPVGDARSRVGFFETFQSFMCEQHSWVRRFVRTGARWELIESSAEKLLAVPAPPAHDPERPWRVFPSFSLMEDYAFIDADAPHLANAKALVTWGPELLLKVLDKLNLEVLKTETDIDYLAKFLEQERLGYVRTAEKVQDMLVGNMLVGKLRGFLLESSLVEVRQHRKIFKRIVTLLEDDRFFGLGPVDPSAKGALPERLLRNILARRTKALPLPSDLAPDGRNPKPCQRDLQEWLQALADSNSRGTPSSDSTPTQLLDAAELIIKAAGDNTEQIRLLESCPRLKVLRAMRGRRRRGGLS